MSMPTFNPIPGGLSCTYESLGGGGGGEGVREGVREGGGLFSPQTWKSDNMAVTTQMVFKFDRHNI